MLVDVAVMVEVHVMVVLRAGKVLIVVEAQSLRTMISVATEWIAFTHSTAEGYVAGEYFGDDPLHHCFLMKKPPSRSSFSMSSSDESSSHGSSSTGSSSCRVSREFKLKSRLIFFGKDPPFGEIGVKPAGVGTVVIGVEIVSVVKDVVTVVIEVRRFVLVTVSIIGQKKSFKHLGLSRYTRPRGCHNIGFRRLRDDNRGG